MRILTCKLIQIMAGAIALALLSGCVAPRPLGTETVVHVARPPIDADALPTSTLVIPSPAPSRTHGALPNLRVPSVVLTGHAGWVGNLAWSPDGRYLASASGDYTVHDRTARLWRSDGSLVAVLSGRAEVYALAWSPDGRILATGSGDQTIRLWRTDGSLVGTLQSQGTVFGLGWSPDGETLASGSSLETGKNPVQLWRPAVGKLLQTLYTDKTGGKFYNVAWSPDGSLIAAGAVDYKLWSRDGTELYHFLGGTPAWALAWSPDSQRWVIGNESGQAYEFDTRGRTLAVLHNPAGNIDALAWSPDGKMLVGGDGVPMWRADGELVGDLPGLAGRVTSVAWSPDGAMFAAGVYRNYGSGTAADVTVGIWNADGQELALLTGHSAGVLKVVWSPDGRILASGSADHTIRLWMLPP